MASSLKQLTYRDTSSEDAPVPILELPDGGPYVGPNRRFVPRVAESFGVRPADGGPELEGLDISFGGFMCTAHEPVWPGNMIEADLVLPRETAPIPARGRVVELVSYQGQFAMRVRFEGLSVEHRKRIAMWMARRALGG